MKIVKKKAKTRAAVEAASFFAWLALAFGTTLDATVAAAIDAVLMA